VENAKADRISRLKNSTRRSCLERQGLAGNGTFYWTKGERTGAIRTGMAATLKRRIARGRPFKFRGSKNLGEKEDESTRRLAIRAAPDGPVMLATIKRGFFTCVGIKCPGPRGIPSDMTQAFWVHRKTKRGQLPKTRKIIHPTTR